MAKDPKDSEALAALKPRWTEEDEARLERELAMAESRIDEIADAVRPALPERLVDAFDMHLYSFMTTHPSMTRRLSRAGGTEEAHGKKRN
jgi:hypothetical protein